MYRPQRDFDQIGYWSVIKLEILKEYASAYSRILTNRKLPHSYIDAFAGAGQHRLKKRSGLLPGSPINALKVQPPFRDYYLIDIDAQRIRGLRKLIGDRPDVHLLQGDCNQVLKTNVLPLFEYESYRRALCILDPYGLQLQWDVIALAGKLGTVDLFLNFPVMGINRNVLWRDPEKVPEQQRTQMDVLWGDRTWRTIAYTSERNLFGEPEKEPNEVIAEAFRQRLTSVAAFRRVPKPVPMRNDQGAVVYYLYFASQADVAEKIVTDIFNKYRKIGASDVAKLLDRMD
jgi:three-Cys-motif partner protein